MSTVNYCFSESKTDAGLPVPLAGHHAKVGRARRLHRLAEVRRSEGVSQSTVARRLNTSLTEIKWQEKETSDLPLSTLYQWQAVLEVPLAELLIDASEGLSPPVMKRAQMVRVMKTARAIVLRTRESSIRRMAQVLVDQLIELMPELEAITPWPDVGQPRTLNELGQVVNRRLSDDVFTKWADWA